MFFNVFFFVCLFLTYIYWVILFRRIYSTKEVSYTYFTYCTSSLRQFMYFFLLFYVLILFSFGASYFRLPIENMWIFSSNSYFMTFLTIALDYPTLVVSLFF
jgi:hypothetical protein